jgi:GABA(A) receptor-associated protein
MTKAQDLMCKYTDRIPCVVDIGKNLSKKYNLNPIKFLTPFYMTLGQFVYIIRKRIKIDSSDAMFVFVDNKIPSVSKYIVELYDSYKSQDGFLYFVCEIEVAFGFSTVKT